VELFCSRGGGQTVELWTCSVVMVDILYNCGPVVWFLWCSYCRTVGLFCSHDGGQTVILWTCCVVIVVDRL